MTLLSSTARVAYVADGASASYPVPFRLWSLGELAVLTRLPGSLADRPLTAGLDYAWDGSPLPGTGALVFTLTPQAGTRIVIERHAALVQELDLVASGAFAAETIEGQFDRLTAQMQALAQRIDRAPLLPAGTLLETPAMPEPDPTRAGQLIGITADGRSYECKVPASLGLQTVSAFAATLLDDPDAAAARATLGVGTQIDLNLLPTDATGGASADLVPFIDASEGSASNKVAVPAFLANAIAGLALVPAAADHELLARDPATGTVTRLPARSVGAGRQTVWIPAPALQPRLTAGAAPAAVELPGNLLVLRTLDFDPQAQEHAQLLVQMPKAWNRGALTAAFLWTHGPAATTFNVVWGLRVLAATDAALLDAPFGTAVQVTDTGGTSLALSRSADTPGASPATPPGENSLVALDIFRAAGDPADTLAVDARLIGIALHYVTAASTDA